MTIGERIKKIRKEKGFTQKSLGQKCGINEVQIRHYEIGKSTPKISTVGKIASALEVPIQVLLGLSLNEDHILHEDGKFTFVYSTSENTEGNGDTPQTSPIPEIMKQYNKLNDAGKQKALEYTTDLTLIEKYQKEPEDNK